MRLKDIALKFKALRLRRLLKGGDDDDHDDDGGVDKNVKKPSWMMPISHGYHVVEGRSSWGGKSGVLEEPDTVVVQREEMPNLELWFYGVSDARIANDVVKYMQSHFFSKKLKESQVRRKSKETMTKAYLNARSKLKENGISEKTMLNVGSASAIVIDGEKLVMAQMGDYRAIVCKDGMAHQLQPRHQRRGKRHWPRRLISGAMRIPKVRMQAWHSRREPSRKQTKCSEPITCTEKIDSDTEFIILASTGVWEVMRNQEAVDLIRHIDHPQEAAECLAREALTRMSRSNISCLVIRLD